MSSSDSCLLGALAGSLSSPQPRFPHLGVGGNGCASSLPASLWELQGKTLGPRVSTRGLSSGRSVPPRAPGPSSQSPGTRCV